MMRWRKRTEKGEYEEEKKVDQQKDEEEKKDGKSRMRRVGEIGG